LSSRLSKFPDAWLLPLFPLLTRVMYWLCCLIAEYVLVFTALVLGCATQRSNNKLSYRYETLDDAPFDETKGLNRNSRASPSNSSPDFNRSEFVCFIRRVVLYICIMLFRGWILYVGLDAVEDYFIHHSGYMRESTDPNESCWYDSYSSLLEQKSKCSGRDFDYSDHMVLYYSQILPISLVETIHSFRNSYWRQGNYYFQWVCPVLLVFGQIYLHTITSFGAYKTISSYKW
jgi:hypothetical protein